MKKIIFISSLLAAIASTQTMAQDAAWYVSGAVGQSDFKVNAGDVPPGVTIDKKDTSFGFAVGYNFSKIIALEAGYLSMGKAKFSGNFFGPVSGDVKVEAPHISAIISAPIAEGFSLYGRLGAARTDTKAKVCFTGAGGCFVNSEKQNELFYGVGLGFAFTRNLTATIEYQKLDKSEVQAINAGLRLSF